MVTTLVLTDGLNGPLQSGSPNTPVTVTGTPTAGETIIASSGTAASWTNSGGTITLAGDVTGAGDANTVVKIQGQTVTSGALVEGNLLVATTTSNWASTAATGDVAFSTSTPGATTVNTISGATPSVTNSLTLNGATLTNNATTVINSGTTKGVITTYDGYTATTNATPANIVSFTLATDTAVQVDAVIIAAVFASSHVTTVQSFKVSTIFKNDNGSVTAYTVFNNGTNGDAFTGSVTISNSTTTCNVVVTGVASTTINWIASVQTTVIGL